MASRSQLCGASVGASNLLGRRSRRNEWATDIWEWDGVVSSHAALSRGRRDTTCRRTFDSASMVFSGRLARLFTPDSICTYPDCRPGFSVAMATWPSPRRPSAKTYSGRFDAVLIENPAVKQRG
ncbi:unnamed protein product, partial [Iphiclides podalirius]